MAGPATPASAASVPDTAFAFVPIAFVDAVVQSAAVLTLFGLLLMMASAAAKSTRRRPRVFGTISCALLGLIPSYISIGLLTAHPRNSMILQEPGLLGGWKIFLVAELLIAVFGMAGMWFCLYRRFFAGFVAIALVQLLAPMGEAAWMWGHGIVSWF